MHKRTMIGIVLLSGIFMVQARLVLAQDERLQKIEQRLNALEDRVASANKSVDLMSRTSLSPSPSWGSACFAGSGRGTQVATSGSGLRRGSSSPSSL